MGRNVVGVVDDPRTQASTIEIGSKHVTRKAATGRFRLFIFTMALGLLSPLALATALQASPGDLVGWWRMEEGSGSTIVDATGTQPNASFTGSPTWVVGQRGT